MHTYWRFQRGMTLGVRGLVIDEAVEQFESAAPILSDVPAAPTREDLNDEIRGMRQQLQASRKPERRRWRRD